MSGTIEAQYSYSVSASCRSCLSSEIGLMLKLNDMPPGDKYGSTRLLTAGMPVPSSIYICQKCRHIQMETAVDQKYLYSSYLSRPATTNTSLSDIYVKYAEKIKKLADGGDVLEIGSNDGLFLEYLTNMGVKCAGIEPAVNLHNFAVSKRKVNSINAYFNYEVLNLFPQGSKKLIFANHSISNIENIREVAEVVSRMLESGGIFILQTFYQVEVMKKFLLENYNHEHLSYFTVTSLANHFSQFGISLFDAEMIDAKGGSIRCYFRKISSSPSNDQKSNELIRILKEEEEFYKNINHYIFLTNNYIDERRKKISEIIAQLSKGKKIGAFGTSIGATVFLSQFGIGRKIDAFFDDDQFRQNLISPQFYIPVLPSKQLNVKDFSICLITAPLYAKNIMLSNKKFVEDGGIFVVFWPEVKIVSTIDDIS